MMMFPRKFLFALALLATLFAGTARAAVFYPSSFTLANGLQVIVVPNHLSPAVNQMVWYKVGSVDEVKGKSGLAHYLEHLMFRGSANVGPDEFSRMIAGQGGNDNAFTSWDYTAYYETVAADRLPMIMSLEADRMQTLRITPDTATPELGVVMSERQQRTDNDPQGRFNEKLRHTLMPHYPYGRPVIGWRKEIAAMTAADANHFYKRYYAPNNAVVIISGDVTVDQVMRLATAIYGPVPRQEPPPPRVLPEFAMPEAHSLVIKDAGVEQPQIQMEIVAPSYSTQKNNEAYALEVLTEALDSGEIGLLHRALVVEQGLASGVAVDYDPDARAGAVFTIAVSPRPGKDVKKLEKAMQESLLALSKIGLDAETVSSAKERLTRAALFARDSLMMPGYSFGMALTTGHTVADVEDWPSRIDAVSMDDVNNALRNLVNNQHVVMGALLPDHSAAGRARAAAHPVINHDMGVR